MEDAPPRAWRERAVSLEAVAVTGVLFAVLFVASVTLMQAGLPDLGMSLAEFEDTYNDPNARRLVMIGYALAPFAAVTFLWFVGVVRRRIPPEDQFVATVFVLSSAVFVALFLVAASLVGGPFYLQPRGEDFVIDASTLMAMQTAAYGLVFVIGIRVQVLIVLTATAAGRIHHTIPRWLIITGYTVAVVQTVNVSFFQPLVLTFPLWVVAVSLTMLVRRRAG